MFKPQLKATMPHPSIHPPTHSVPPCSQIEYPEIEEGTRPRHRVMSAYEQRKEPWDKRFQYLLFSAGGQGRSILVQKGPAAAFKINGGTCASGTCSSRQVGPQERSVHGRAAPLCSPDNQWWGKRLLEA